MMGALKRLVWKVMARLPVVRAVALTRRTQTPVPLGPLLRFHLRRERGTYWPVHPASVVVDAQNIRIGVETSPGSMPGCYIQGSNGIVIGDYTQIASNISIVSANHALTDNRVHIDSPPIRIGAYCWIGANAVILPGVELGDYTVVGAGAVVTKSFPEGHAVIAGNPARVIRTLDPAECVRHRSEHEYCGFIAKADFAGFARRRLSARVAGD